MNLHSVIIRPLITEKAMKDAGKGKFTFAVQKTASKTAIKQALNQTFKVNVTGIQTSVNKGQSKRVGNRRQEIMQSEWKKAIVTLKKGEKIDLFEAAMQSGE